MDDTELANDAMEKAHEAHGKVPHAKIAAIAIATLAAALAISEMGAKGTQNGYLAHHISASDTWSQYQAKSVRRATYIAEAATLEGLSAITPDGPARDKLTKQSASYRVDAERMSSEPGKDGMEQLAVKAHGDEHARDEDLHVYHGLEKSSSGLQIAIVLASVSVVTGIRALLVGGSLLGAVAGAYGLYAIL